MLPNQYRYEFSCSAAEHYTDSNRKVIEGSFDSLYQLTDREVKNKILEAVPFGFCSVYDFDWTDIRINHQTTEEIQE